jgi:hypothetical protein
MSRRELFNLPNTISLSRVVLALAFVLVSEPWDRIALIAVAGFTDFMDGWLARHRKDVSTAGALLDPLADRIFVLVAISTYHVEGKLPTGQYFLFLTRDIATAVGFVVAKIVPNPSRPPSGATPWQSGDRRSAGWSGHHRRATGANGRPRRHNRNNLRSVDHRLHHRALAGPRAIERRLSVDETILLFDLRSDSCRRSVASRVERTGASAGGASRRKG